jgi:hypothetical protein
MSNDTSHQEDTSDKRSPEELAAARKRALVHILKYAYETEARTAERALTKSRLGQIIPALDKRDPHSDARQTLNAILVVSAVDKRHAPFKRGDEALAEIERALKPEVGIAKHEDIRHALPYTVLVENAPYVVWSILMEVGENSDLERQLIAYAYTSVVEEGLATTNDLFNGLGHKEILPGLNSGTLSNLAEVVLAKCLAGFSFSMGDLVDIVDMDVFAKCATVHDHWKRVLTPLVADPNGWLEEEVLVAEPDVLPEKPKSGPPAADAEDAISDDDLEVVPDSKKGVASIEENLDGGDGTGPKA